MSIVDYIFADVTDVSGQDNTDACEDVNSISFEQSHAEESRRLRAKSKSAKVCHKRAKKRHRGAQGQGHVTHLNLTVCFAKRTQVHVVES